DQTLPDLIRGLRTQKTPAAQQKYIKECLNEIRDQVRSTSTKVEAVRKLGYLHMLGYDLSWAAFHVIEVMASSDLQSKKIGYAVAASAFKSSEEVWMLATNQIRKDLSSSQPQHVALALHFLATHLTPVLARDLFPEISRLLSHSRPYIRKRAVLVLWRVALCGGSDLGRESILKVREKLADSDQAVVATAVNVLCELARKNPKSYLPLAPQLYGLLVNSSNNWMSIKIVKLFSALTPHEPRLARKLVPHLEHIIETTSAMSLLYECLQTLILGQMIPKQSSSPSEDSATDEQSPTQTTQTHRLATLCATKLQSFITSTDQNLKYLGLHLLSQLFPLHPSSVLPHRATILACLSDRDISIRTVSLHIVINMITPATLPTITNHLLNTLESLALGNDEQYKALVLNRILDIIESDTYANVSDFEWLVEILLRISIIKIKMASVGDRVSRILIDVSARVDELRPFAVKKSLEMVQTVLGDSSFPSSFSNLDVLWGAMYIIGAYPSFLTD
ncbi:Clathrin/coatomer adaptor, adaptin-like protein, partial [Gaertneriomyces semiglobifer]